MMPERLEEIRHIANASASDNAEWLALRECLGEIGRLTRALSESQAREARLRDMLTVRCGCGIQLWMEHEVAAALSWRPSQPAEVKRWADLEAKHFTPGQVEAAEAEAKATGERLAAPLCPTCLEPSPGGACPHQAEHDAYDVAEVKAEYRCDKCGVPLNEGTAKCFTVCDACWDKWHEPKPAPDAVTREDKLRDRCGALELANASIRARLSECQAQFFIECARIAAKWGGFCNFMQWASVGKHLRDCKCSTEDARSLVREIAAGLEVNK